ncbi:DNA polymerase III subunit delta [Candidatus Arsenophonus lipoptenae]|uniref:DNA polymerase III subunit delta n=1 Tax=Candidatus Arsenophonus lipoptenae TaxID=634113 RepID=A0A0X8CYD0_9GAMM|nr:DNA polymerase III subunit delta [Candidatus Arsenophonus lipoptenae]AMA65142.1 DNA polymerase III subunit delta [Candidatus Arsenophonus lipoptenae]
MIHICTTNLNLYLNDKIRSCYLVIGDDAFLLQESIDKICEIAHKKGFTERYTYSLDTNTDWNNIYHLSKSYSLFSRRQIIILILPESGYTTILKNKLLKLSKLLHSDLLLILCAKKLTKEQENSIWYKKISKDGVYINCQTPELHQFPKWISKRAKVMSITLDEQSIQLLCYYYEGNLLALNQIFKLLLILYPDGNFTLSRVQKVVNDNVHFKPYHWIDMLLQGNIKRSWHILQQLKKENYENVFLLHIIQRELILILTLKYQSKGKDLIKLFNQNNVWQYRRPIISTAIKRLSIYKLQLAIQILNKVEVNLKKDYCYIIWPLLEILSILLCSETITKSFINEFTS